MIKHSNFTTWAALWQNQQNNVRLAKTQVSLRIRAVSQEPSLFAQMMKCPTKNQTSSPTGWMQMPVWRMSLQRTKSTIIAWHGSFSLFDILITVYTVYQSVCNFWTHYCVIKHSNFMIWAALWQNQQNNVRPAKTLMSSSLISLCCRLGGCPGWSESWLGAQIILLSK